MLSANRGRDLSTELIDARAIEETAKTAGKAIDAVSGTGKYLAEVLGHLPANVVSILANKVGIWADGVYHDRVRRWAELTAETREHLKRWGAEEPFEEPTRALALPLISAAIDEDRKELKDLWARLLASAMHPDRKKRVRRSFIGILKQLDPLDALCLRAMGKSDAPTDWHSTLVTALATSPGEIQVSFDKLVELNLVKIVTHPHLSALGKLFVAAVED
jgi:hypothetical protein